MVDTALSQVECFLFARQKKSSFPLMGSFQLCVRLNVPVLQDVCLLRAGAWRQHCVCSDISIEPHVLVCLSDANVALDLA